MLKYVETVCDGCFRNIAGCTKFGDIPQAVVETQKCVHKMTLEEWKRSVLKKTDKE
jgi:hypothetical protein